MNLLIVEYYLRAGNIVSMDDQTRKKMDKIFKMIKKREKTFGKVLIGLAFSRNDQDQLNVCYGIVKFLGKDETPPKDRTYDYGDFILTKKLLKVPKALNFMRSIFENQIVKFNEWPEIPLKVYLSDIQYLYSNSRYAYISSAWPMLYAYGDIDSTTRGKVPHDSLSKRELPLFPGGTEAIDAFFELHLPEDWHRVESRIDILVPDYRARIKNLRLIGNKVAVEVEAKEISYRNILAKFYCKTESKSYTSGDLPLKDKRATYITHEEPIQVEAHIFSTADDDRIDGRKFDYRYPSRGEGIIIENNEAQLLNIIDKGENVNVEFKRALDKEHVHMRFLETAVAFANTNGGTIFLGVDDNCHITGFKEPAKAKIEDLIADHCDPPFDVQTDPEVLIQGTPITLVKVSEGTNKPYTLKDRGIFIRRGSSNRQIKRTELDDIYAKKQSPSGYM